MGPPGLEEDRNKDEFRTSNGLGKIDEKRSEREAKKKRRKR